MLFVLLLLYAVSCGTVLDRKNNSARILGTLQIRTRGDSGDGRRYFHSNNPQQKNQETAVNRAFKRIIAQGMKRIKDLGKMTIERATMFYLLEELLNADWHWVIIDMSQNISKRHLPAVMRHFQQILIFNKEIVSHDGQLENPHYIKAWKGIQSMISAAESSPWEFYSCMEELESIIRTILLDSSKYSRDTHTFLKTLKEEVDSILKILRVKTLKDE